MASWSVRVPLSVVPWARAASRAVTSKAGSTASGPSRESGSTSSGDLTTHSASRFSVPASVTSKPPPPASRSRRASGPRPGLTGAVGSSSRHRTHPPRARCSTSHSGSPASGDVVSKSRYLPRRLTAATPRALSASRGGANVFRAEMAPSWTLAIVCPRSRASRNWTRASTSGSSGTGALRRPSAPRVAEATGAALARWQLLHQAEPGRLHPLDHQLGDAVTAAHPVGGAGVGVDEQDADLVTVAGVDQPRRVEAGHPAGEGQPAAGLDEPRVPVGYGNRHARRHQCPPASRAQGGVLTGDEIGAGVACPGVAGKGQVGIEPPDGHVEHAPTLPPTTWSDAGDPAPKARSRADGSGALGRRLAGGSGAALTRRGLLGRVVGHRLDALRRGVLADPTGLVGRRITLDAGGLLGRRVRRALVLLRLGS